MNTATQVAQEFRARHDYSVGRQAGGGSSGEAVDKWDGEPDADGPTLEELEVTADTYRKMYESFLHAYTGSVSQQWYPVADARVITPASRPLTASHPRRKLAMIFGALFGLMAGVGLAFAIARSRIAHSRIAHSRQASDRRSYRRERHSSGAEPEVRHASKLVFQGQ
jgi:hypothetical protein